MPEYRHPRADDDTPGLPPARVHISRAETASVDADGVFQAPRPIAQAIADQHGVSVSDMAVTDGPNTCQVEKADGEICGRELPCPYHSED